MAIIRSIAFAALAACGGERAPAPPSNAASHASGPPDPQRYARMTPDERCEATAPRTRDCTSELIEYQLHTLAGGPYRDVEAAVRATPEVDADAALRVHETMCLGNRERNAFPDAVVACWSAPSCSALADCVSKHGGI